MNQYEPSTHPNYEPTPLWKVGTGRWAVLSGPREGAVPPAPPRTPPAPSSQSSSVTANQTSSKHKDFIFYAPTRSHLDDLGRKRLHKRSWSVDLELLPQTSADRSSHFVRMRPWAILVPAARSPEGYGNLSPRMP